jgi:hypothetical protein
MIPKAWTEYNLMHYEKRWFEQLETIEPGQLRLIIDHNNAINQSASFKYNTIVKFITVLMGYNSERQQLALDIIEKYWKQLDKSDLLSNLLHHAPFEFFKKYFSKARLKPDQAKWLVVAILKHDTIEEAKWIVEQKKFDGWLDEDNLGFIDAMLEKRLKKSNPEVLDLVFSKEKVVIMVTEKGYTNLVSQEARDLFLF